MRASVLLPEPLGPRIAAQELAGICQVMFLRIQRPERSTPTAWTSMANSPPLFASPVTSIQYGASRLKKIQRSNDGWRQHADSHVCPAGTGCFGFLQTRSAVSLAARSADSFGCGI